MVLHVDNTSTIALMKNPVFNGRSKHIKYRFHYIREKVEVRKIIVEHIREKEQSAYILTKALTNIKFVEIHKFLGVKDLAISSQKLRGKYYVIYEITLIHKSVYKGQIGNSILNRKLRVVL